MSSLPRLIHEKPASTGCRASFLKKYEPHKKKQRLKKECQNSISLLKRLPGGATTAKLRLPPIFDHYLAAHPFKTVD